MQHCKQYPRFEIDGGSVTVIGHSLGSVIMFDLLSHHHASLLFHPQCLICMGSPLGMFLPLQQEVHTFRQRFKPFAPMQTAPEAAVAAAVSTCPSTSSSSEAASSTSENRTCKRIPIVNVFHPNDPVASRLEPLLDPSAALIPPAPCTHSITSSNLNLEHSNIMKLMTHVRSLALKRMHDINWADVLTAGQTSSARLM
jgi:pimeloyl-ACP methyl ester carboxylesterase